MRADLRRRGLLFLAGLSLCLTGTGSAAIAEDNEFLATAIPHGALSALTSGHSISAGHSVSLASPTAIDLEATGAAIGSKALTLDIHDLNGINVIAINNGLNSRVTVSVQATLIFRAPR